MFLQIVHIVIYSITSQTCSIQYQPGLSGKQSATLQLMRENYSYTNIHNTPRPCQHINILRCPRSENTFPFKHTVHACLNGRLNKNVPTSLLVPSNEHQL